jgi:hypothetical protein
LNSNTSFRKLLTPDKKVFYMPVDVQLAFPREPLSPSLRRRLAYIPWKGSYLRFSPKRYRDFLEYVLPYLKPRTTDVHTALCLSYLKPYSETLEKTMEIEMNKRVVACGLTLHDCGWSALTEREIADSLAVKGLSLENKALAPKRRHADEGARIARKILNDYEFEPPLKKREEDLICDVVFWHDKIEEVRKPKFPAEIKAVADLDHLWSFTKPNFWQDTVRKNIKPQSYSKKLGHDLTSYFIFEPGKKLARGLLKRRKDEVSALLNAS